MSNIKTRKKDKSPRQARKKYKPVAMDSPRFVIMMIGLFFLGVVLLLRLSSLQIMNGVERGYEYLQRQGESRMVRKEVRPAQRGMILDRNGEPLAVSTRVHSLIADPQAVLKHFNIAKKNSWTPEQKQQWNTLADFLSLEPEMLEKEFLRHDNSRFKYLKRQMVPEEIQVALDLKIPGIFSQQESKRFYPVGEVTGHFVGITDIDDIGQEGLELAYNQFLKGENGVKQVIKDLSGRLIRDVRSLREPKPGNELISSIDLRLQYLAYRELKAAVVKHKAKAGSVVVLDVETGEVLAMVNQPAVNPNDRASIIPRHMRNRALTDVFEPGSTVKPFTMLAALEGKRFTPGTVINTSPGWIQVGDKTLKDSRDHGVLTLTQVLQKSSQVGTTKVALSLKSSRLWDTFYQAGLGQVTGGEFPGERMGDLPNYKSWKNIDKATFSFGHGLAVTLLQLARAYTVFANDGYLTDVSFVKREKPGESKRVFREKNAKHVLAMLRTVTQKGGTGTKAAIPSYSVAGKTGTAHKLDKNGYANKKYIASFVGLVPSNHPRVVIAVMIDEPSAGEYYGGDVAAPVFSSVGASAMRVLNVKPDAGGLFERVAQR